MTTVQQLIEYLQTLPPDATVETITSDDGRNVDLVIPHELSPYSSDTIWYDNITKIVHIGD